MFKYSKAHVITMSVIISILVYLVIIGILKLLYSNKKLKNQEVFNVQVKISSVLSSEIPKSILYENEWKLNIPKINLNAEIKNGTNEEILNKYIGHFEETEYIKGNIGLAAHNRGYMVNFFNKIKTLKKGDLIIYQKDNYLGKYKVESKKIIKDDDWKYLKQGNKEILTLITCVENEPKLRLCVQAIKEENK